MCVYGWCESKEMIYKSLREKKVGGTQPASALQGEPQSEYMAQKKSVTSF